jgi:hypothetical protein
MYFINNKEMENIMKKIVILTAVSIFVATAAFAADNITMSSDLTATNSKNGLSVYGDKTTATTSTALIGKTSTGVSVGMKTSSAGYSVVTQHKSGTKAFGSSYDSTSIYSDSATVGTAKLTVPTDTGTTSFSGWTTQ